MIWGSSKAMLEGNSSCTLTQKFLDLLCFKLVFDNKSFPKVDNK